MSGAGAAPQSAWPMFRAVVGVGLACGLVIVSVYELTRPVIAAARKAALEAAIFDVLPTASSADTFAFGPEGFRLDAHASGERVHVGRNQEGRLVGVAIEASGMGYQDTISILYGYSVEEESIVGFAVLESRETPGLGDRIEIDPQFLGNFESLDVRLNEGGDGLAHPVEAVPQGEKVHPWQVDSITGATISSQAIANILHQSAELWGPRLREHGADLEAIER